MTCLSLKAVSSAACRFSFFFLVFALVPLIFLAVPRAQAQDQPAAGSLRGVVSPPPGEDYPSQPVPPPVHIAPKATIQQEKYSEEAAADSGAPEKKKGHSRPPATVFPPAEYPYAVNMAMLRLKVVSAGVLDRISFGAAAQQKALQPGPGKKLVVAILEGKALEPIRMPIAILDFSAFWVEERIQNIYGKKVSERSVQSARAVALETPKGWLIEGKGLPDSAVFYLNPGPVSLRVGFFLPEGVTRFGVRYPLIAEGDAIIASGAPSARK